MSRFIRPDTATLTLANGDTLVVKMRLCSGDQRAAFARMYLAGVDGALKINPLATGMAMVTAYLVDWHLVDDDIPIRGLSIDDLTAVLDNLAPEDFTEIKEAIEAHEQRLALERIEAKKKTAGTRSSDPTSPSLAASAGASSGSVN